MARRRGRRRRAWTGGCRSTRPAGASGPGHAAAGQPRPRHLSGPVGRRRGARPATCSSAGAGRGTSSISATACCPRPTPTCWRASSSSCTTTPPRRRSGTPGASAVTPVGVLVMAHGTPALARRARPPSTPRSGGAARRRPSSSPTSSAATGPSAGRRRSTSAPRPRSTGSAPPSTARAPGRFTVAAGAKFAPPRIEEAVGALGRAGVEPARSGLVLAPHSSAVSVGEYARRARAARPAPGRADGGPLDVDDDRPLVLGPGLRGPAGRAGARRPRRAPAGGPRRGRGRLHGPQHPGAGGRRRRPLPRRRCAQSAAAVAEAAGVARWSVAWQSAGRTADAWLGPDVRDVIAALRRRRRRRPWWCARSASCRTTSRSSTTSTSRPRAVADDAGIAFARTASLNDDPGSAPCWPAWCSTSSSRARLTMTGAAALGPRTRRGARPTVAVIGGGIAGLSAAWELASAAARDHASSCSRPTAASGASCARDRSAGGPWSSGPTPSWPGGPRPWPCAASSASVTSSCRPGAARPTSGPRHGCVGSPPGWPWGAHPPGPAGPVGHPVARGRGASPPSTSLGSAQRRRAGDRATRHADRAVARSPAATSGAR